MSGVAARNDDSTGTADRIRAAFVPEVEVLRALPDGMSTELDASRWEELLRALEPLGNLHVIVTNGAVTLESFGQFGNFSTFGAGEGRYFNVQSKSLDMHIRPAALAAAFAVEKPGHMDGVNTLSFQFYDREGAAAFKVFLTFGGSAPPAEKREAFDRLRAALRLGASASASPA
jgi:putative hemin transport protein